MKKNRGFTLIEMLVVMVVIGILAAIAIPSYQNQLRRGTRSATQALMMDVANKQQFYLQSQRTYASGTTALADLGIVAPQEVSSFYTIDVTKDDTTTPPSFLITATPKTGTRQDGDGNLTLNQKGDKGADPAKW